MPKIIFRKDSDSITIDAVPGETLLDAASRANVDIFAGCSGSGICGTCNVFIDESFVEKTGARSVNEIDLLALVAKGKENARLACQVIITDDMDGMTVTVP